MTVGSRNQRIDVIRGVAVLLVLLHHFNIAYRLDDTVLARAFGWDAVRALVRNGNYGVTMFLAVSGYLITSNARRRWGGLAEIYMTGFYGLRAARASSRACFSCSPSRTRSRWAASRSSRTSSMRSRRRSG